jgi:single-strand DNA-binding protein
LSKELAIQYKEFTMNHFNLSVIEGHLARDPVLETVSGKYPLCKFTVGTNRSFTKRNGEKVEDVGFFDVTAWSRLGETCAKYLKKGSRVLISGNLKQDSWKDKEGKTRTRVYVDCKEINFLPSSKQVHAA